eukprot:gene13296-17814_t
MIKYLILHYGILIIYDDQANSINNNDYYKVLPTTVKSALMFIVLKSITNKDSFQENTDNHYDMTISNKKPWFISSVRLNGYCRIVLFSRKYDDKCLPNWSKTSPFPLLLTGLGGSGTHMIANNLSYYDGLDLKHEELGRHGSVCWFYAVNNIITRTEYPCHAKLAIKSFYYPRFYHIIHIIRSPLHQISSFTTHLSSTYKFVLDNLKPILNCDNYDKLSNAYRHSLSCNRGESCKLLFAAMVW